MKTSLLLKIATSVLFSALLVGAIYSTMRWATVQSDDSAIERQGRLVALVVGKMQDKIAHDQESATVWDDAVKKVGEGDQEWMDANLGRWMHTYFGHDAAFVLGPTNALVYGFSREEADPGRAYSTVSLKVWALVNGLRRRLAAGDTSGISDTTLSIGETDIVSINGSPAIVSVKPIISDSGKIEQTAGQEFLHIAVRYLDGDFGQTLGSDYLFADMRFEWNRSDGSERSYFPLRSKDGSEMGFFSWIPFRPGTAVLRATEPVLMVVGLLVGTAMVVLVGLLQGRAIRLRKSQGELFHLAHHDALSGLPNRVSFNAAVEKTLTTSEAAILFLDLDRFKQVNDTLGHPAGDRLIAEVAIRLKAAVGEGMMVARLGGDEFTLIIPDGTVAEVELLAERLITAIRQPFELDGQPILIGLTIGIAFSQGEKSDAQDVLRRADIALYSAKSTGRNRYAIFGPHMEEMIRTRRELEHDLRVALNDGQQIEVHYQPIYVASDGRLTGVEALCRWRHPSKGLVQPDTFVTLAEESGLIEKLGDRVLMTALTDAKLWPELCVAVNASAFELRSETYALRVIAALEKAGFDPRKLEIEITESAVLENEEACRLNIARLRQLGVRFAIDDFGTGFSSFGRLQQLDVDRIKIDRCFVEGYGTPDNNEAIVEAMISLAHAKNMRTTAEGIETNEQKAWLRQLGCDELQGYLLSKPVIAGAITDLYRPAESMVVAL